jgi:hypothetical protein
MPSHAPLCGINRPHARYWSRTNRIDSILELPPVTSDTATVPPPTRSPEPKVTRYIVIRNDQHDGSSHQGKIFIVAGNRPAAADLPRKATITFRNHSAHPDPAAPVPRPPAGPARRFFRPGPTGRRRAPGHPTPSRLGRPGPSGITAAGPAARATLRRASAEGAQSVRRRPPGLTACALARRCGKGMRPGYLPSYAHVPTRRGGNDREDFFPDVRNSSYECENPSR